MFLIGKAAGLMRYAHFVLLIQLDEDEELDQWQVIISLKTIKLHMYSKIDRGAHSNIKKSEYFLITSNCSIVLLKL